MSNEDGVCCKFEVNAVRKDRTTAEEWASYNQKWEDCPAANDIDLTTIRNQSRPSEVLETDLKEMKTLCGGQGHAHYSPFAEIMSGEDCLWEKRSTYPMNSSEDHLDDLIVLSGIRTRDPEELFIEELEQKLERLTSEVRSATRILKDLIRERHRRRTA